MSTNESDFSEKWLADFEDVYYCERCGEITKRLRNFLCDNCFKDRYPIREEIIYAD